MSSLSKDETLKIAEGKEEGKRHMVRNNCPSLFQHNNAERRQNDLFKQRKYTSVHTSFHDLCLDVSLLEVIPPRSSHDEQKSKVFPQPCASMSSLYKREANTTLETLGKKNSYVNHILFHDCMYSLTLHLQAITPKGSVLPYKLHGQLWAKIIFKYGHSLDGLREVLQHDGCFPKAPNIHFPFSHGEMIRTESKWHANHLPYIDLKQGEYHRCWFLLGEFGYHPRFFNFLSHALYFKKRMHKKKACLFWLMRREDGHSMMNSISIHLLVSMMYVHVFLFRMNIVIMYVLWVGRRCNLLMGWLREHVYIMILMMLQPLF